MNLNLKLKNRTFPLRRLYLFSLCLFMSHIISAQYMSPDDAVLRLNNRALSIENGSSTSSNDAAFNEVIGILNNSTSNGTVGIVNLDTDMIYQGLPQVLRKLAQEIELQNSSELGVQNTNEFMRSQATNQREVDIMMITLDYGIVLITI